MKKIVMATAVAMMMSTSAFASNIVQTAASTGQFNTLLAAAKAAGLAGALGHTDGITVFAPTDEAFAKLPKGTVENLLKPENRHQLVAILKYHVVPAVVPSSAAKIKSTHVVPAVVPSSAAKIKSTHVGTLKEKGDTTLRVRKRFGKVYVDRARVINADIQASNGVIHVIDKVLLPSS